MNRSQLFGSFVIALALFGAGFVWQAEAGENKSESKVKATAVASKVGADGKQKVTITIDIEKSWHLYANPVNHNNETLNSAKTTVKISAKESVKFKVTYPKGKTVVDKKETYDIYEGVIKIEATVDRTMGDASPLEVSIRLSACNESTCLLPGTVVVKTK
ncbi:MAG: hypothetical protein HY289_10855 [Planctomycetes bacterium]|nr:hypothetical protein [Planctomycetota bacterium]